jgi:MoaA/NifB/PqqE/SkfB family radical SAM enzyme
MLVPEVAADLARLANVTPLISIEGREQASDDRRGGTGVYAKAIAALDNCRRARLIYGVATSVCRTNIDDLVTDAFVHDVIAWGAHYLWYYIYRPVGADPAPDLVLTRDQVLRLRRFLVEIRPRVPIAVIDSYWDADGRAFCPAAAGLSYHISPGGGIEPCPVVQFARDSVAADGRVVTPIDDSAFLRAFATRVDAVTRGCVLMEAPEALADLVAQQGARPTSGRDGQAELAAMVRCGSHDLGDDAIPESHWLYRWGKRHAFFGMGSYG